MGHRTVTHDPCDPSKIVTHLTHDPLPALAGTKATAQNRDFCLPYLHSTPPLGGSRRNVANPFGVEKLE